MVPYNRLGVKVSYHNYYHRLLCKPHEPQQARCSRLKKQPPKNVLCGILRNKQQKKWRKKPQGCVNMFLKVSVDVVEIV